MRLRALSLALTLLLLVASACEYHDEPEALSLRDDCYQLADDGTVTIWAQVRAAGDAPLAGISVSWSVEPTALMSLDETTTRTADQLTGSFHERGVTSNIVRLGAEAGDDAIRGSVTAAIVADGTIVTASARVERAAPPAEGEQPAAVCLTIDAGAEPPIDASTSPQ